MSGVSLTKEEAKEVVMDILSEGGYFSPANLKFRFMEKIGAEALFDAALESLRKEGKLVDAGATRSLLFVP